VSGATSIERAPFAPDSATVGSARHAAGAFVLQRAELIAESKDEREHCIGAMMISGNLTCMKECEIRCASA